MKSTINAIVEEYRDKMLELSQYLRENPEVGLEEFKSSKKIIEMLKKEGFEVQEDFKEMPTAFVGRKKNGSGPKIAFLAEYDSLPEIGHACGHNLIASMSFGAAAALSKALDKYEGEILIVGSPSEETGEGKPFLIEKGVFDDVDIAMMIHPCNTTTLSPQVLAIGGIDFNFYGKATHASAEPHLGVNALDAVVLFYNNINALRQQLRSDARVHGIILEAGSVVNSIPDKSKVRLEMRAKDQEYFLSLVEKVKNCARAAELATGTRLEWNHFEPNCDSLNTNNVLLDIFKDQMNELGVPLDDYPTIGSTDMGNVSQVVPSIHPFIKMAETDSGLHTKEFLEAAKSKYTEEKVIEGAKLLAFTGLELLQNPDKLAEIRKEFDHR